VLEEFSQNTTPVAKRLRIPVVAVPPGEITLPSVYTPYPKAPRVRIAAPGKRRRIKDQPDFQAHTRSRQQPAGARNLRREPSFSV